MTFPIGGPDIEWVDRAACRNKDPLLFHPPTGDARPAKKVCARCEVRDQCLAWALAHVEIGVWGGTTSFERDEMRRRTA